MVKASKHGFHLVIAVLWAAGAAPALPAQGNCNPHGGTRYICGVNNAEDLIRIEGTPWVLSSQLGERSGSGGFYLIDVRDRSVRVLAPDLSRPADQVYSACPGAPDQKLFAAHGLAIRYRPPARPQVYAVNHGGRESVEVFELDLRGTEPGLIWRGCALAPEKVSGNSVTPLPGNGFAVTSFGVRTDKESMSRIGAGQPSGFVAQWMPGAGWSEVPGTEFSGDNGIVASKDGATLYIAGWGDRKVHIVSRGKAPATHQEVALVGFHPDNIREGPNGVLLVAGQVGELKEISGCFTVPVCPVGSKVVRLDPKTLQVTTLVEEPGNVDYGGTSGALIVNDEIWLGTFRGNRIARIKLKP